MALADDSQTACASQDYLDDKTFTASISTELSVGVQLSYAKPLSRRFSSIPYFSLGGNVRYRNRQGNHEEKEELKTRSKLVNHTTHSLVPSPWLPRKTIVPHCNGWVMTAGTGVRGLCTSDTLGKKSQYMYM